jgi:hypothetical protein
MRETEFAAIVFRSFTIREAFDAGLRQQEAFISDAVDSLVSYVRSIGDGTPFDGGHSS